MEDIRRITTPELVDELARGIDPLAFFHPVEEERSRRYKAAVQRIGVALSLYNMQVDAFKGNESEEQLRDLLNRRH